MTEKRLLPRRRQDGAYYVSVGDLRRWLKPLPAATEVRISTDPDDQDPATVYRVLVEDAGRRNGEVAVILESGYDATEARKR